MCGVTVYDSGEGPVAESCENVTEISDSKKFGHFLRCVIISFWRQTLLHGFSKAVRHKFNVCVKINCSFALQKKKSFPVKILRNFFFSCTKIQERKFGYKLKVKTLRLKKSQFKFYRRVLKNLCSLTMHDALLLEVAVNMSLFTLQRISPMTV